VPVKLKKTKNNYMRNYNWWEDPKNKEQVERISWWNHPQNKEDYMLPISVVESDGVWVATCNDETKKVLGDGLHGCAQGDSKADAIDKMFQIIRLSHEHSEDCVRRYQRWVPFRKGDWGHIGGTWFVVFGFHVYFRYGKNMKGGWYLPFTKLNVSVYSEWASYRRWKMHTSKKR
jgi:hypothetical protein